MPRVVPFFGIAGNAVNLLVQYSRSELIDEVQKGPVIKAEHSIVEIRITHRPIDRAWRGAGGFQDASGRINPRTSCVARTICKDPNRRSHRLEPAMHSQFVSGMCDY